MTHDSEDNRAWDVAYYVGSQVEYLANANGFTAWFFLFIGLFWFGSVGLMSFAGGWHWLASRFRASSRTEGECFRFATMYIRSGVLPVSYVNCLFVTVSPAGVRLSVLSLLRFLHPPLFVPWSAVSRCTRKSCRP